MSEHHRKKQPFPPACISRREVICMAASGYATLKLPAAERIFTLSELNCQNKDYLKKRNATRTFAKPTASWALAHSRWRWGHLNLVFSLNRLLETIETQSDHFKSILQMPSCFFCWFFCTRTPVFFIVSLTTQWYRSSNNFRLNLLVRGEDISLATWDQTHQSTYFTLHGHAKILISYQLTSSWHIPLTLWPITSTNFSKSRRLFIRSSSRTIKM